MGYLKGAGLRYVCKAPSMPRHTERQQEERRLLRGFFDFVKVRAAHLKQRARRQRRFLRRTHLAPAENPVDVNMLDIFGDDMNPSDTAGSNSSDDADSGSSSNASSGDEASESDSMDMSLSISNPSNCSSDSDSQAGYATSFTTTSGSNSDSDSDSIPDLDATSEDDMDLDDDASASASADDWERTLDVEIPRPSATARLARRIVHKIHDLYKKRYRAPREPFPRPPPDLPHVLTVFKTQRPDHFRKELRVYPSTFDRLLEKIKDDPVFTNNSQNDQMPIEEQLAILLYRFGHYGNAASLDSVAKWSGKGKGTVLLATRRVMTALLRPEFMDDAVDFPTEEEKEEAKRWVEDHSCGAWRGGWCMVDGTLVPLHERPFWYGESYFDRKSNYSLNIQV